MASSKSRSGIWESLIFLGGCSLCSAKIPSWLAILDIGGAVPELGAAWQPARTCSDLPLGQVASKQMRVLANPRHGFGLIICDDAFSLRLGWVQSWVQLEDVCRAKNGVKLRQINESVDGS